MIKKINTINEYINENFLITLTNKGIYNRSIKDIEKIINEDNSKIKIEDFENKIKIIFDNIYEEKIEITIDDENIQKSICTCPSQNICKHIIMALLYIKNYYNYENNDLNSIKETTNKETKETIDENTNDFSIISINTETKEKYNKDNNNKEKNRFDEIKNITIEEIKKLSSKKNLEYALYKFYDGAEVNIVDTVDIKESSKKENTKENAILEINIVHEGISVYFPKKNSIQYSVCSCKDKNLCYHRILAILKYKEFHNALEEIKEEENNEIDENILNFSKEFIEIIFAKGLYSCSENDFDTAEQLSIKLEMQNMHEISKMFRSIAEGINSMLKKKASFNKIFLMNVLSRIYNTIKKIESAKKNNDYITIKLLTGDNKAKYNLNGSAEFLGIGAFPWVASSGYAGVSAYIYDLNNKKVCTVSSLSTTFYDNSKISFEDIKSNYTKKTHFSNKISIEEISKYQFKLIDYKIDYTNRLSSAASTYIIKTERIDSNFLLKLKDNQYDLFANTYDDIINIEFKYDYFDRTKDRVKVKFVSFEGIENINFSKIDQTLYFDIVNNNETLSLKINYNIINNNAIEYIMNYKNNIIDKNRFMLIEKTKYTARPISIINSNSVINIFLQ